MKKIIRKFIVVLGMYMKVLRMLLHACRPPRPLHVGPSSVSINVVTLSSFVKHLVAVSKQNTDMSNLHNDCIQITQRFFY